MSLALVTGASRGIGKACAVHLAQVGYDVALLARTVTEGEPREHSSTVHRSDMTALPGSLDNTADLVRDAGARADKVPADLLDRVSVVAAVESVLERHGRVDVLVNNGRYIGPGHMDALLDTPIELIDHHLEANVIAPLLLTRAVLPAMIAAGKGLIVNMTSNVAWTDPPGPAGKGGWGLGYAISKGALHRAAGVLAHELAGTGVVVVNVSPGFIATERMAADMATFGFAASAGAPPDVVGAAVAWLASHDEAAEWHGQTLSAQKFCKQHRLVAGWPA